MAFAPDSQKRLRSWLEHKLNKGDCLGLVWIRPEDGIFRFPWYKYKDLSEDMRPLAFKVFVDWAKFSNNNKYREGEEPNYPAFKHNMRCALNKLKDDFEKLEDNSHIKDDPHIVYRFVSSIGSPHVPSPSTEFSNNLDISEDKFHDKNIPQVVHSLAAEHQGELCFQYLRNAPEMNIFGTNESQESPQACFPDFLLSPQPGADFNLYRDQNTPVFTTELAQANSYPVTANYNDMGHENYAPPSLSSDLLGLNSGDLIGPGVLNVMPMSGVSSLNTPETSLELNALLQPVASRTGQNVDFKVSSINRMKVKVSYGQPFLTMMDESVGENGCRLFFGNRVLARTQFEQDLYGPREVTDIMLPIVDQCSTEINEQYVKVITDILQETDRGFTLTFKDRDIYAQRHCRSRVYFCDANFNSFCLDRKSKSSVKVFDFNDFYCKLTDCMKSPEKNTRLPPSHFYLTIGIEVNPANKNGPMSKVPICICITHLAAEEMYNQAHACGRGQCDSMQPAHSGLDSSDQLLEMYKGLTINPLDK